MMKPNNDLSRLRIASPCPTDWESMNGNDRVRFCRLCELNVYDISAMTSKEARELIARTEGRLCARLYRRADGTVITADCPVGWRALKRRASFAAGAALTALLSLCGGVFGQTPAAREKAEECRNQLTIKRADAQTLPPGKRAPLAGKVLDPTGADLPGAIISMADKKTKKKYTTASDENGAYSFSSLPAGSYELRVTAPGFKTLKVKGISLGAAESLQVNATLLLSGETVIVGVIELNGFYDRKAGETVLQIDGVTIRYDE
jgi:hypothetical protein